MRLRVDALAQILSLANVCHNSRVLIYERTNGFVCASVLDRMSGEGRVVHALREKQTPNLVMAEVMGLPSIKERWQAVRISDFNPQTARVCRNSNCPTADGDGAIAAAAGVVAGEDEGAAAIPPENLEKLAADAAASRIRMELRPHEVKAMLAAHAIDSLIVVDDEDPAAACAELFPHVRLSGAVCVYSPYLSQLLPIHARLRDDVVGSKIQETWFREMQVLPNRTHPQVNMSHTGGYLFSAIKVEALAAVRAAGGAVVGDGENFEHVPPVTAGARRQRD